MPSAPKFIEVDKDDVEVVVPRPAVKSLEQIVEKPATLGMPEIARVCKKYFPGLGEMLRARR
jgi:hypothetical protein